MDDNKPIRPEDVAGAIMAIAENVPVIVGNALQEGYQKAVAAFCGFGGEVTIKKESWNSVDEESVKATVQIKLSGVGENDIIIFSPKTANDRKHINYAELFISPIISTEESTEETTGEIKKLGVIDVSCVRYPTDKIALVYSVMRTSMAHIQNSTTNNPSGGEDVEDSGDQVGPGDGSDEDSGMVEIPIEED